MNVISSVAILIDDAASEPGHFDRATAVALPPVQFVTHVPGLDPFFA